MHHLAFFGHHKCASTSISHFAFDLANYLGLPTVYKKTAFVKGIGAEMKQYKRSFLISLNSAESGIVEFPPFKGLHLIRDPRDICVSAYFSHLYSHDLDGFDRLVPHRKALKETDKEKGLFLEFEFSKLWLDQMNDWNYNRDNIYEVKMEDLFKEPELHWIKILEFFGYEIAEDGFMDSLKAKLNHLGKKANIYEAFPKRSISNKFLLSLIDRYSFRKLSEGRTKGEENEKSHYRKGEAGDWVNHFTDEHKKVFKEMYGKLLIKLGYEKDLDW